MANPKRRKMDPDFVIPLAGSIVKIELQHFMCHTFFEIELSPCVNFIVGRNGSGKSAILMALVMGLGGKSSATNRAPNMTEFIKQGSSWGQVAITICNKYKTNMGEAFNYHLYGDTITVERKITKSGSSYKLKSNEGKVISTSKRDLTLMLDHYNIQVNNPVSILNQEMSKMFLASTDPADKYKFFMKSTHLEQMVEDYQMINERKDTTKHTLERKKKSLPDLRGHVRHLEGQYKEIAELRDLGKKVSALKDECVWSKVKAIEEELIPIQNTMKKYSDALPNIDRKIAEETEGFKEAEALVKAIEAESKLEMDKYSALETDQMSLRQQAQVKKRKLQDNRMSQKRCQRSVQEAQNDKRHLLDKIKEMHQTNATRNREAEREQRELELDECNRKLETCTRQMTETTANLENLDRKLSAVNDEITQIKEDGDQYEREKRQREAQLKTMREATRNRVRVFGNYMPGLLRKIDESTRFHKKPRGPFGLHIKVRDQKWATVIEHAIGSYMTHFVVHDQHDKNILHELFRQCCENGRWPNLIMMRFRDDFYTVSQNKPSVGYPTVYDMLDIQDNMISNALVEQARIEQCLLIESSEEARRLIVGHAPRNVFQGYTLSGDEVKERGVYSNNLANRPTKFFQNDPTAAIELLVQQISTVSTQLNAQRAKLGTLEKDSNKIRTLYRNDQQKQRLDKTELSRIRMRLSELDNLEEVPLMDATALEEEVVGYDTQLEQYNIQLRDMVQREEELRTEYEEADKRHTQSIDRDGAITNKLEELRNNINKGQQDLNKKAGHVEVYKNRKKDVNEKIKSLTNDAKEKEKEIKAKQDLASQRCPRVEVSRPARNLEQQIIQLERRIEQGTRSSANVEEITRRFHEAKRKYEEIVENIKYLSKFAKKLGHILEEREERYFFFRKEVTMRMKYFFMMNLSQRGYQGKLEVDHERKHLKMQLNVDTSGASKETHDVRTLSGGERSYSTVCFICSIWNIMESPFRCLDEFDVFMDLYNRRITMTMLMDHAYSVAEPKQYILFTPQDMSAVTKKHKSAKVFQLEAPERNEKT